ncbi:septum formation inhibitor Maf [Nonlabens antarcticus]|uniref:septum formation inhibitor Maf n=1 Tax=Nonlabens antarcticus TaxID=392714 RepID=UPI001890C92E|nr:septum formation inhibitor Maf [Nonlabens antarcticus]
MRSLITILLLAACIVSCNKDQDSSLREIENRSNPDSTRSASRNLSNEFKDYWYSGVAEISSYDLKMERYGEIREGTAVMIFVTEPFSVNENIKTDQNEDSNRSMLKLNATRDFYTGIYPYKIMSSTFLPLSSQDNAVKVATSIQEWCGHTYMQLDKTGDNFEGVLNSYFQGEGNQNLKVEAAILENEIPLQLRLGPEQMPTGKMNIIPSTEYLRLTHKKLNAQAATANLATTDSTFSYRVDFKGGRKVTYVVGKKFPYEIISWKEEFPSLEGMSTTTAVLRKTLKTAYWQQNSNKYSVLRDSLDL